MTWAAQLEAPHLARRRCATERRWTNSRVLVSHGHERYRQVPIEVTDHPLTEDERLRVWIYIHRQRKEWDAREKEMTMMDRSSLIVVTASAFALTTFAYFRLLICAYKHA
jgi:hypothetical protein